jgi:hypothetical protein
VGKRKTFQREQILKKSFFLQKKMIFLKFALSTPSGGAAPSPNLIWDSSSFYFGKKGYDGRTDWADRAD